MESFAASIAHERGRPGPKQGGLAGPMRMRAAPLARPAQQQPSWVGEHGLARGPAAWPERGPGKRAQMASLVRCSSGPGGLAQVSAGMGLAGPAGPAAPP
jgi:hypothetical protein